MLAGATLVCDPSGGLEPLTRALRLQLRAGAADSSTSTGVYLAYPIARSHPSKFLLPASWQTARLTMSARSGARAKPRGGGDLRNDLDRLAIAGSARGR